MTRFKPIREWSDLSGMSPSALETYAIDFKAQHNREPNEHAKDIAAFANAFGGAILVGVAEKSDSFMRNLMPIAEARRVALDYENAARDLLAPRPIVDPCLILPDPDGATALVAINVEPFAGQLIGAKLSPADAWRFPVRTAARHTTYFDPEKVMIYSDPRARKASILLDSIPEQERTTVYLQLLEHRAINGVISASEGFFQGSLVTTVPADNMVHFNAQVPDQQKVVDISVCAPLEDIDAVWKAHGKWHVRLNGMIVLHKGEKGARSLRYLSGRGLGSR